MAPHTDKYFEVSRIKIINVNRSYVTALYCAAMSDTVGLALIGILYPNQVYRVKGYNFENTRNKYYVIGTILKAILQGIC